MKTSRVPKTDSIKKLAEFWDTHDLTDFENELELVNEPVFERDACMQVHLPSDEAKILRRFAKSKGMKDSEIVRQWIHEKIQKI